MRTNLLRTAALTAALLGGVAFATAQTVEPKKHEDMIKSDSGKAGKEEPSAHTPTAPPENAAFWNGALVVPGAPANTDTVPAKHSAKNDADDKLPTWGYAFKHLNGAQRRAIYQSVKKEEPRAPDATAAIGVEVPPTVNLMALPSEVTAQIPETKSYRYVTTQTKVLLVNPLHRVVVEVLE